MNIERDRFKRAVPYKPMDRTRQPVPVRDISEPSGQHIAPKPILPPVMRVQEQSDLIPQPRVSEAHFDGGTHLQPIWAENTAQLNSTHMSTVPETLAVATPLTYENKQPTGLPLVFNELWSRLLYFTSMPVRILFRVYRRLGKRASLILAALAGLILVAGIGYWLSMPNSAPANTSTQSTTPNLAVNSASDSAVGLANTHSALSGTSPASSPVSSSVNMPFTPVVPLGEGQLAQLGSKAYDSAHNSYTFDDLFLAQPLQVSEQLLPQGYATSADALAQIAGSLKATTTINTTSGTAYIATSSAGQQTVIFSTKGLLVFVQSAYRHSSADWSTYLDSLQ